MSPPNSRPVRFSGSMGILCSVSFLIRAESRKSDMCNVQFFFYHCIEINIQHTVVEQDRNADPSLKPDFHIFLLIFQHKYSIL